MNSKPGAKCFQSVGKIRASQSSDESNKHIMTYRSFDEPLEYENKRLFNAISCHVCHGASNISRIELL